MSTNHLNQARVLVVDDETASVTLLTTLLKAGGYSQIRATSDPSHTLELLEEFAPDLILLDLMMPVMDGFEVLASLRAKLPPDTYLPVLVLTGDASPQTRKRALAAGANDFLVKPLDGTEVLLRIKNLLETRFLHLQIKQQNRALETQFLRAQRLESIGRLASGIAHDLNNVLAPILLAGPLLREEFIHDENRDLFDAVVASARRGADILKQILSFARGMEGKPVSLQPRYLLKDMATILANTFPKNISLDCQAPPELWQVVGDATQLTQVLLNLCVNARDAMPGGGKLLISAENHYLEPGCRRLAPEAKPGAYVLLKVSDTGTGIAPEVVERVFEPFFTTKGPEQGTGLGLSTVLAVVKSHGGFVSLQTQLGRGTTFEVYLPAAAAPNPPPVEVEATLLPVGSGEVILLVDDEPLIRASVQRTLERYGYRVLAAANGAEALALYSARRHDVRAVICDMMMPVMDGPATIRAVRQLDPGSRIISLSGVSSHRKLEEARYLGLNANLNKPCSAEKLLGTLKQVLLAS